MSSQQQVVDRPLSDGGQQRICSECHRQYRRYVVVAPAPRWPNSRSRRVRRSFAAHTGMVTSRHRICRARFRVGDANGDARCVTVRCIDASRASFGRRAVSRGNVADHCDTSSRRTPACGRSSYSSARCRHLPNVVVRRTGMRLCFGRATWAVIELTWPRNTASVAS